MEAFETLADWVAALHGGGQFQHALERLAGLLRAEAAMAIRHVECTGRHRQIAVVAPGEGQLPVQRRHSIARDVLGDRLPTLRAGAVWILSEERRDAAFFEEQWLAEKLQGLGVRDVAAVVLGTKAGLVDYCELQFLHATTRQNRRNSRIWRRCWPVPGTAGYPAPSSG